MMRASFFLPIRMLCLLLIMGLNTQCQLKTAQLTLVKEGKSAYSIVTSNEASSAEKKAAGILQDYLKRISGAEIPIITEEQYAEGTPALFVGKTAHTGAWLKKKITGEGFVVGSDARHLYISGGSGQGVVYGIYSFLEKHLGCRKYSAEAAVIPRSANVLVPPNMLQLETPALVFRQVFFPESNDPEYLSWHRLHKFEDLWGVWGHSFFRIVPPSLHFKTHPEYFAEVNGKRQASQLCLSNPEVIKLAATYLRKAIAANPDAMYWSIAQEDGGVFCQCNSCSAIHREEQSISGSLIRFINKVAAQFPGQYFTTLAYGPTSKAPLKTAPAGNVFIMLSNIDAYREKPVSEAPSAAAFRKDLEGWSTLTPRIFIWDYTTQFTNYLTPFPAYTHMAANMKYLFQHRVTGAFLQGSGDGFGDMSEWNSYLQSALCWNPSVDTAALFKDFTEGYYKQAAKEVQQYIMALQNAVKQTNARLDIYGSPIASYKDYLSPEHTAQLVHHLEAAWEKTGTDTVLQRRLEKLRLPLEYTSLEQSKFFGTEKNGFLVPGEDQRSFSVNPAWLTRVKTFVEQAKKAGVTEISEGGASPEVYAAGWEKLFARTYIPGMAFRAPVQLKNEFTPEYSLKKEQTLTDGLTGTEDFSFNWLFTYGNDMVATIDLGKDTVFTAVQMNVLFDARHYIFPPEKIIVETSINGTDFTEIIEKRFSAPPEDFSVSIIPLQWKILAKGRYVRVRAVCLPTIPAWRMAPGNKKPALCVDEIFIGK